LRIPPEVAQQLRDRCAEGFACEHELNRARGRSVVVLFLRDECDEARFSILSAKELSSTIVILCLCGNELDPLEDFAKSLEHPSSSFWITLAVEETQIGRAVNELMSYFSCDLAIIDQGVEVCDEWLGIVQEVAERNSDFSTISSFAVGAGAMSVPNENSFDGVPPWAMGQDAYRTVIKRNARALDPTLPRPGGAGWLIGWVAWNVVGGVRDDSKDLQEVVALFGLDARKRGFRNILADGALLIDRRTRDERERVEHIQLPLPAFRAGGVIYSSLINDRFGGFCLSKDRARLLEDHVRVAVDCTSLSGFSNGTTVVALCSALELKKHFPMTTAIVRSTAPRQTVSVLQDAEVAVEVIDDPRSDQRLRFDILYRPNQIHDLETLQWIKRISDRGLVNILDLIPYHMSEYHASFDDFAGFRNLQRLIFETLDGFAFLSDYVREDAFREYPRLSREVCSVVSLGVDAPKYVRHALSVAPARRRARREVDFTPTVNDLLISGVAYRHKNRVFALCLAEEMWKRGWQGRLFMSGPFPSFGSSEAEEREFRARVRGFAGNVVVANHVEERAYQRAQSSAGMMLYPSITEGFGLPPFEAAELGTACVTGDIGVFRETLPSAARLLGSFSVEEVAPLILDLLGNEPARREIVDALRDRATSFTWERSGQRLKELIDQVLERPRNPIRTIVGERDLHSL